MRIQDIVLVVRDIHTYIGSSQPPVAISGIRRYVEERMGIRLATFGRGAWDGKHILGRMSRYEKDGKKWANIVVSDALNQCWTRFVACKELAHLVIDKEDGFTSDVGELIRNLVEQPLNYSEDIASERLAIFAAAELLVPWKTREMIRTRISDSQSNYEIANIFKVPEKLIELWRTDNYQKVMGDAWKEIE